MLLTNSNWCAATTETISQPTTASFKRNTLAMRIGYLFLLHLCAAFVFLWQAYQNKTIDYLAAWASYFLLAWVGSGFFYRRIDTKTQSMNSQGNSLLLVALFSGLISSPWLFAPLLLWKETVMVHYGILFTLLALAALTSFALSTHFPASTISTIFILLPVTLAVLAGKSTLTSLIGACIIVFAFFHLALVFRLSRLLQENLSQRFLAQQAISELKEQVEAQVVTRNRIEQALDVAEHACLDKTRFLAAASHDLRQPVHAISLFVAAMKSEAMEERSRYLLERLDRSLAGLDDLFNRLLDISRLDAGLIQPSVKLANASLIAQTLETRFTPMATKKCLRLHIRCQPGLQIHTDPDLLIELLSNLLSNAIRHTDRGGILLAFREHKEHILVQVWDTGCGIAEHHLAIIFDEFVQINHAGRDRAEGLGLGLSIVKRLTEALGYQLFVRSRVGRGSCFGIKMERVAGQLTPSHETIMPSASYADLRGSLVLVVDDEPDILAAMEAILLSWGCYCMLARTKEEAAHCVDASLRFPDVIITDHRLTDHQTSFDIAAAVDPLLPYDVPMIVISGESSPSLEQEIQELGWLFMSKPVNAARLHTAISFALEKTKEVLKQVA